MSTSKPQVESTETQTLQSLAQKVEALEERVERVEEEKAELREELDEEKAKNERARGAIAKLVNELREYDATEDEGVTTDDPEMTAEVATVAKELRETTETVEENTALIEWREKQGDIRQTKVEKQEAVLRFAEKQARANDTAICRMDYRQVAREYGCHHNDAYRVMEQMEDEVPGVSYKNSRTLGPETQGVGGKHVEIQLAHPELRGWLRSRRED